MTINPLTSLVLNASRSMLGEMESPPNSNLHPTVTWYRSNVEDIGRAWNYCNAGVSREFSVVPAADPLFKDRAYVPWCMQDFIDGYAGSRLIWIDSWNDLVANLQPGDVVFYDWEATKRHSVWVGDHVGIAEGLSGNDAVVIEHNTSVPGTGNEGVARKVRDSKYIAALGRPAWGTVEVPKVYGTNYPLLEIDGSNGPNTLLVVSKIMSVLYPQYNIPVKGWLNVNRKEPLVLAIQWSLNKAGHRCKHGKPLRLDGMGFGSNTAGRYPATGFTHTIEAMQIAHGVSRRNADGYFDAYSSTEVERIQRDSNVGGVKDNPFMNN